MSPVRADAGREDAPPRQIFESFEARSTPPRSFTGPGFAVLGGLLGAGALASGALFAALGAWPVLLFMGAELPLAVALVWAHHRRSGRALETVSLSGGVLRVSRTDARGARVAFEADAHWTRLEHDEARGTVRLTCRGRAFEVGLFLGAEEKAAFAAALSDALRRHREPRFDNPVLRRAREEDAADGGVSPSGRGS